MWQDIFLMLVGFALTLTLVPTVLSKKTKPHKMTCLFQAVFLAGIAVTYMTLGLVLAAISAGLNTGAWGILLFQRRGSA